MTDLRTRRLIPRLAVCLLVALTLAALARAQTYVFVKKWGVCGSGNGQFHSPKGVALDGDGNVYVADWGNSRIQKFTSNGDYITQWGVYGTGDGEFRTPNDVAVDPSGSVYVADTTVCRIQRFNLDGVFRGKWGARGSDDMQFLSPNSVAVDDSGNVYVADGWNDRIQKFTPSGTFLTKWGSEGTGDGQFRLPTGVAVGPSGNLYVTDTNNKRIQKFGLNGTFLTKWGSPGDADGQFTDPRGLATDAVGNVYVADFLGYRIQKFTSAGHFITKWGSHGSAAGQFGEPFDVAVDAAGNVYVVDRGHHCVHKFTPDTPKPDMRARLSRDRPWRFNDVYGPAYTQKVAVSVPADHGQLFYLSIQNDSRKARKYRIYGTGLSGRWSIIYYGRVEGELVPITDAMTGGGGWETGRLKPGKTQVLQALMKTPPSTFAVGGSSRSAVVRAVSRDGSTADAVKLVLRVRKIRRPDARIKLPSERRWTGNNVYDEYGKQQIIRRSVRSGRNAIYHLSFQNDGNAPDSFKITGPGSNAQWRIRYFAALSGGTNVTPEVTGGGWATPQLKRGEAQEMLVSVTPKATAFEGDRKVVRIVAAATDEPTEQDAVKAITTVESASAAVCQVTSLAPVPTRAGAQLTFALSSDARVTATVLNVAGRPIKTILADKPLAAGVQTLLWNRTNDAGLAVPHGMYLVRVVARDQAGAEASALASLALK